MDETLKYEKRIGLKTIWLTFVRRWKLILLIFIPLAGISFGATRIFIKTEYQSYVEITKNSSTSISQNDHNNIVGCYRYETILQSAVDELKSGPYKISVSINELKNNLSFSSYALNETSVVIYYKSAIQSHTKNILDVVSKIAIEEITSGTYGLPNAKVSDATSGKKSSKENTYLLISIAVSLIVALAIPFIDEIISDEVYDKNDIEYIGCEGFEIDASKYTVNASK